MVTPFYESSYLFLLTIALESNVHRHWTDILLEVRNLANVLISVYLIKIYDTYICNILLFLV